MSSWTQVYIKGLAESTDPSDEQLEEALDARYELSMHPELAWAGPGSTIVKRTDQGVCRGYAFLCFFSAEGATVAVERIESKNLQLQLQETTLQNHQGEEEHRKEVKCDNDITPQPEQLPAGVATEEPPLLGLPLQLHAELCKPKPKSKKKKQSANDGGQDYRDLRIRRQRGAPVRKHPVITNSDGSRTCLGNKTK